MYAISLASGQSIVLPRFWGDTSPNTYTGVAGGLIVVLNSQEYYSVLGQAQTSAGAQAIAGSTYTDVSKIAQSVLDIPLPTGAAPLSIVAGRASYVGFSVRETTGAAAASLVLSDTGGSINDEINIASGESAREFYSYNSPKDSNGGMAILGILQITASTGSYAGIIRIVER